MLATKVYGPMGEGVNDRGLSAHHIRKACEDSLRRLQTDHIDLYQMHHVERSTPWEEIWQAMELVQQGKVLYVGSSNFAGLHIAKAQHAAEKRNFMGLRLGAEQIQPQHAHDRTGAIPACREYGLGLIPIARWAAACSPVLNTPAASRFFKGRLEAASPEVRTPGAVRVLCGELGEKPADVALAWMLKNPVITKLIIGPRTMQQLKKAHAVEIDLSDEVMARLDEIWPGLVAKAGGVCVVGRDA
ncbi:MAG: aldo/keto reductase [Caldilineaceae bacterium]